MKKYNVTGEFRAGHRWEHFSTVVEGPNDAFARERVLSTLGSRHRVSRNAVRITSVEETK